MARIAFYSKVVSIQKRSKEVYVGGFGQNAKFRTEDMGYFMVLEGSHEALFIGHEVPEFRVGDRIKITMERKNV